MAENEGEEFADDEQVSLSLSFALSHSLSRSRARSRSLVLSLSRSLALYLSLYLSRSFSRSLSFYLSIEWEQSADDEPHQFDGQMGKNDPKENMAFLQNNFRCPPLLGARRT